MSAAQAGMPDDAPLRDVAAITAVILAYATAVDEARLDQLGPLFAEDAVLDYGRGRHCTGREEVVAFVAGRAAAYRATSHHLSNIQVELDGPDQAAARTYVYAWHERPNGTQAEIWGRYLDRLVRTPEGWRIARRAIRTAGHRGFTQEPGAPSPFEQLPRRELP